ncbi:GntR family transcriptional regulator [Phyllobacterium phragmitis]|uniref:GntR family transcriptional regulator n=2 Tax=Phyllobacterium phragmitis TaxID=2670329 RepID=A0A2S9IWM8_9HYPH|nr:GntR family transcriptional regulator [Phyllobacterium phragmitis]
MVLQGFIEKSKTGEKSESGSSPRKRSLYEELYGRLKENIGTGRIAPGTVLLEGPLAELLGSSRAPVRQALKLLADENRISRFEGRGFVVGPAGTPAKRVDLAQSLGDLANHERTLFAWQALYEEVERRIVNRSFFGRFRINEIELARHYGVGRAVARDVLLKLETLGITSKDEHFRWSIVPLDDKRITELYEVRERLEPFAIAQAMDAMSDSEIERMTGRLVQAAKAYPQVSVDLLYDLELDLHVRSMQACPNREMISILQRTHCVITLSKHVLWHRLRMPENDPFIAEHIEIFEMMRRRNRPDLMRAMSNHIASSRPKVIERAEEVRNSFQPEECSFIV